MKQPKFISFDVEKQENTEKQKNQKNQKKQKNTQTPNNETIKCCIYTLKRICDIYLAHQ